MASEEQKQLANAIKPLMKDAGFKKTAFNWHRKIDSVVQVLNFQGSQWSKSLYINLGVYFLDIGDKEKPPEYDCHIRQRLAGIAPDLSRCNELFNFENTIPDDLRFKEVSQLIQDVALPWLDRCSTKEGAKHYLQNEKKHGLPVPVSAKQYLGLGNS